MILLLWLYAVCFPGLFVQNTSINTVKYSIYVRINDIVGTLPAVSFVRLYLGPYLVDSSSYAHLGRGEHVTGYAYLIRFLPTIILLIFIIHRFYFKQYRRLKLENPYLTSWTCPITVGLLIFPLAFPIWGTGLYWFMISFVLLPLMPYLDSRYFNFATLAKSI